MSDEFDTDVLVVGSGPTASASALTATTTVGTGQANPIGSIWSTALMLDHLGYPEWGHRVERTIEVLVADGQTLTPDLGGTASCGQVGDALLEVLAGIAAGKSWEDLGAWHV
jgi:isocitrate/isopropylmalate dehydrogenase